MICVVCQDEDRAVETGQVCDQCGRRIMTTLDDIPALYARLTDEVTTANRANPATVEVAYWDHRARAMATKTITPGTDPVAAALPSTARTTASGEPHVSGSHEPPLPVAIDALDLTLPARAGTIRDPHGDQTGQIPVAARLDDWVRDWRDTLDLREGLPVPTVPVLCGWLADRLDKACRRHPAVDEFAADMARLRATLRAVSGDAPARPQRLTVPCQDCNQLALVRVVAREVRPVCCRACGRSWSEDEYAEWVGVLAHAVRVPATDDARMAA
jgi:hypothetical protein